MKNSHGLEVTQRKSCKKKKKKKRKIDHSRLRSPPKKIRRNVLPLSFHAPLVSSHPRGSSHEVDGATILHQTARFRADSPSAMIPAIGHYEVVVRHLSHGRGLQQRC